MRYRLSFPRPSSEPVRFAAVWTVLCAIVVTLVFGLAQ